MTTRMGFGIEFGPADRRHPICHDACREGGGDRPARAFSIWDKYVSRVELSLPVMPSSPTMRIKKASCAIATMRQGSARDHS